MRFKFVFKTRSNIRYSRSLVLGPRTQASKLAHSRVSQVAVMAQQSVLSSRYLDFCSLALCSFVLTMLCHTTANLPHAPVGNASGGSATQAASTPTSGGMSNFLFKLYTMPSAKPEVEDEE